jgi:serine/threonine-protein kinase
VEQIRSQQQAEGLDIRGDVLASLTRMNSYMRDADRALSQKDLASANDYMDRANGEIEKLEKFLGR